MADNAATLPAAPAQPVAPAPAPGAPTPATGQSGAAQNQPQPAKRSRAPRRDNLVPSNATIQGVPQLYTLVPTAPFYTVQQKVLSTFVLSFIAISLVIQQMNFAMSYTHRCSMSDFAPKILTTYPTAANHYCFTNSLYRLLPNIPLYMDALLQENAAFTASTDGTSEAAATGLSNYMKYFWHHIHNVSTATSIVPLYSPAAWLTPYFTEQNFTTSRFPRHRLGFPPRLDATTDGDMTSLAQYLRFYQPGDDTQFFPWFQNVASVMQSTASGLPIWKHSANNLRLETPATSHARIAATVTTHGYPAYAEVHHLQSVFATGHHSDESLEEIEEQSSALAQVNIDLVTNTNLTAPTNAHIRTGPIWSLPKVRSSPTIDYTPGIGQVLTASYHLDTRNN